MWNGEFYPCKPDIFEKTYESMEDIKEKTADEMFEELGYEKNEENDYFIEYKKQEDDCCKFIKFDLIDKSFTNFYYVVFNRQSYLLMKELQAINKKCKELGWI